MLVTSAFFILLTDNVYFFVGSGNKKAPWPGDQEAKHSSVKW